MRRLPRLAAVLAVLAAPLLVTGTAAAEPPSDLTRELTDTAGVLDDPTEAQAAIDSVESDTDTQLFVVFVDSFDGQQGQDWADATAVASGLGPDSAVFAVAVDDGLYGLSVGDSVPQSDSDIQDFLTSDVEPELSAGDWDAAVVAVADGLGADVSNGDGGSGGGAVLGVIAAIAVVGGGGYVFTRNRKRRKQADAQRIAAARAAVPFPDETTEKLTFRASQALLELDEAVRTSSLELDFARASYGDEPVAGFAEALAQSRAELQQAFTLRQQLDDEVPEDEPTQRRMLAEVLRLTGAADTRLDAQAEAFDQLRDLEKNAPQALDRLAPQVAALQQRLPQEEQRLTELRQRYADSAVAPVTDNVEQARARLEAAAAEVEEARGHVQGGQPGQAVGSLRVAEDAVAQSGTLLDGIGRLAADLTAAPARLAAVRVETEQDLAEARALLDSAPADPTGLAPLVARAQAAVAAADAVPAGQRPDPLAALRQLEEADAAPDRALAGARDAATRARRAAAALDQTVVTARSTIAAASDFIGTRRGAVGPEARTRLAEAQRRLDAAVAAGPADPVGALRDAQQAAVLAQQALDLARADVDQWSSGYGPGAAGYGAPGYGGPGYGGGRSGVDLGSLVLGGI